jgi:hypothetical protein
MLAYSKLRELKGSAVEFARNVVERDVSSHRFHCLKFTVLIEKNDR